MNTIPNDPDSVVTSMTIKAALTRVTDKTLLRFYKAISKLHRELRNMGDMRGCLAAEKVRVVLLQEINRRGIRHSRWWTSV